MLSLIVFPSSVIICWFYDCFYRFRRRKVLLLLLHFVCVWNVQMCERSTAAVLLLPPLCTVHWMALSTQTTLTSYPASGNSKPGDGAGAAAGGWLGWLPGLQSPLRIIPEKICSSFEKNLSHFINEVKLDHEEKKWATWKQSLFSNRNAGLALFLLKCIQI